MSTWHDIVQGFEPEARRELLAALLGPAAAPAQAVYLDQSLVPVVGGCAEADLEIWQWMTADGTPVKVRLRALSFRERMAAETAATAVNPKTGRADINPWRLMAEEVARAFVTPRATVDHVLNWNDDIVRTIHAFVLGLSEHPPERVNRELSRMAGGAPPEPARGNGDDALPADAGGDGGGAPGGDAA